MPGFIRHYTGILPALMLAKRAGVDKTIGVGGVAIRFIPDHIL
jgi:hypothetical protein